MTAPWKAIIIRFIDVEFSTLKEYCEKNHIKITELIRNAVRLYIANPNIVSGVVKASSNDVEIKQVLNGLTEVAQKLESLEKKLNSYPMDEKITDSAIKARIKECIMKVKQKYKKEPITVDKLRIELKKIDPSLTPYFVASAANGISHLDEVLIELHGHELNRDFNGIIKFNGD